MPKLEIILNKETRREEEEENKSRFKLANTSKFFFYRLNLYLIVASYTLASSLSLYKSLSLFQSLSFCYCSDNDDNNNKNEIFYHL